MRWSWLPPDVSNEDAFPLKDCSRILALADDYWKVISDRDARAERIFEEEFEKARRLGYLPKDLFVRVARWKSVRSTRRYRSNSDSEIRKATEVAFRTRDETTAIRALKELNGVALRTASAILHWMHPNHFPILDYRVMSALGESEPKSYEDVQLYIRVADRVRALANEYSLSLREIDRALWSWDKRRSKSVRTNCRK
jgi:thermostable 8-oxoguanine DNA glycosylase